NRVCNTEAVHNGREKNRLADCDRCSGEGGQKRHYYGGSRWPNLAFNPLPLPFCLFVPQLKRSQACFFSADLSHRVSVRPLLELRELSVDALWRKLRTDALAAVIEAFGFSQQRPAL